MLRAAADPVTDERHIPDRCILECQIPWPVHHLVCCYQLQWWRPYDWCELSICCCEPDALKHSWRDHGQQESGIQVRCHAFSLREGSAWTWESVAGVGKWRPKMLFDYQELDIAGKRSSVKNLRNWGRRNDPATIVLNATRWFKLGCRLEYFELIVISNLLWSNSGEFSIYCGFKIQNSNMQNNQKYNVIIMENQWHTMVTLKKKVISNWSTNYKGDLWILQKSHF